VSWGEEKKRITNEANIWRGVSANAQFGHACNPEPEHSTRYTNKKKKASGSGTERGGVSGIFALCVGKVAHLWGVMKRKKKGKECK